MSSRSSSKGLNSCETITSGHLAECRQIALQLFTGDRNAAAGNKFDCFNYTEFIGSSAFILKLNHVS